MDQPPSNQHGRRLHDLVEAQVERTPEAIAVTDDAQDVTYRELWERASCLARHLRGMGVVPEERVGLCMDRSADALTGMLGILQAGGAYVALDPAYPQARLAYMLEDSGARWVVTRQDVWGGLGLRALERVAPIRLDADAAEILRQSPDPAEPHPLPAISGNLAYLIYTSGSTGRAKGVAIEHRSAVSFVDWAQGRFSRDELSGVLAATSFCFDLSVFEIFAPLSVGGRVILARNALQLPDLASAGAVTLVNTVPSAMAELLRTGRLPASVRTVNLAGEPLRARLASEVYAAGVERLYNLYGPSEDTTYSTEALVPRGGGAPTIGRPIAGTQAWVLGPDLDRVAGGSTGELLLGGDGLARGYLGRPELTAERFIPDPFSGRSGARLYRTGDLVRTLPDGDLDFLGRADHQVKIRGFRIELGEIESVLSTYPGVSDTAVVVREGREGDRRVVAYAEPVPGHELEVPVLRDHLAERLPAHMMPATFVLLPVLPRLPNGKIDRGALPAPPMGREGLSSPYEAPHGPLEEEIAALWEELTGVVPVGRRDLFLELGGHSLLAAQVAARLGESLGMDLPAHVCLATPTVEALAARIEGLRRAGARRALPALQAMPRERRQEGGFPLSDAQKRLWLQDRLARGSALYNIPEAVRLRGALDVRALARALGRLVERHEVLRTTYTLVDHEPVQVIAPAVPEMVEVPLPVLDLRGFPSTCRDREATARAESLARAPFDLETPPLLRAALLRLDEDDHLLLLVVHHIAADGWSLDVVFRELAAAYAAFRRGAEPELPTLPVQYADFALWQCERLGGEEIRDALARWRQRLEDAPALDLPADRPRPAAPSWKGITHRFAVHSGVAGALRRLARGEGATLFMASLAVFQALLGRVTGQEDFVVGAPSASRPHPTEGLIGFFVNLLPLRADLSEDPTGRELLRRVRDAAFAAYADQDVPFDRLVEELRLDRDPTRPPLLQAVLAVDELSNVPRTLPGLEGSRIDLDTGTAKFDLTLTLEEQPDGSLRGALEASADLFAPATVAVLAERFIRLLAAFTAMPDVPVGDLPVLAAEESRLLEEWNRTALTTDLRPVHEQIAEVAVKTPERVAVSDGEASATYAELTSRANQLARWLRRHEVGPEKVVAVLAERSVEMVEGQLATLVAGGAFLPLDPDLPAERLRFLLADSRAALLLTQERLLGRVPDTAPPILRLDADRPLWEALPVTAPRVEVHRDHLAYVIYTSGSTGEPKGVAVRHAGLSNLVSWHRRVYELGPDTRASSLAGLSFDAAVWELWPSLTAGARVALAPDEVRLDPARLLRWLAAEEIDLSFLPTPLAEAVLAETVLAQTRPAGLRLRALLTGGDALHRRPPAGLPFQLVNHYGPTENSVVATWGVVPAEEGSARGDGLPPSIGRPIGNVRVHLLDAKGRLVPPGVAGELCLGGTGLARGYLGRPELTAERFVPDPFAQRPGGRLYRTGDRARWLADGTLQFLGRFDHQVKIRGFRVELGEIEGALVRHPGLRQAAVLLVPGSAGPRLVAWVVPSLEGEAPAADELRAFLRERLPAVMVPAAFVVLGSLPLTPNGKLDRRALPVPEESGAEGAGASPRGETEELLLGIWQRVLGRQQIGAQQDFFQLGGHSLLAAQVLSRVQAVFGIELPLRSLFEGPTVAALAARVEEARGSGAADRMPPLVPHPRRSGRAPLSLTQQGLWFLSLLDPESSFYNIPSVLKLRGSLDAAALEQALIDVARRHEALRTTIEVGEDGRPEQVVAREPRMPLPVQDLSGMPEAEREARIAAEVARPFDLGRGPLLRALLLRLDDLEHVLVLTVHHVVADGWSIGILHRELAVCYEARRRGAQPVLPEPSLQQADHAVWQRRCAEEGWIEPQVAFWKERLTGLLTPLDIPADRPRPAVRSRRGATLRRSLPAPLAGALRELGRSEGATLLMVLRAGFEALLSRYTGRERFVVGAPVAGRNRPELERLIGFLVHVLPIPADLSGSPDFRALLARVRTAALESWEHQEVSFERLVEELQPAREEGRNPLFEVLFSGNPPAALPDLAGLEVRPVDVETGTAKFDLTLFCEEREGPEGNVELALEVDTDRFEAATAERLLDHLLTLLESAAADPGKAVTELALLPEPERRRLLDEWGWVENGEPCDRTIPELFEERCAESPDAVALLAGDEAMTYGELNRRANRLAHHLRRLGVGIDLPVGLCAERSFDLVVGLLGILKAGGAYVPLDPSYPAERLAFMMADARLSILVGTESQLAVLPARDLRTVVLGSETLAGEEEENPVPAATPHSLAYVLFTSGSTGRPKGVAVPHRGVVRLVRGASWAEFGPEEVFFQYAPVSFDLSTLEVWGPLLHGARLALPPPGRLSLAELGGELRRHRVSFLWLTAGLFHLMVDEQLDSLRGVRQLMAGGDILSVPHCERVLEVLEGTLINGYGPTENTTFTTCHAVRGPAAFGASVPIGRPIDGTSVVIVDTGLRLLPQGVPGELLTGGDGLARGYAGRPDLTAERFVPDPCSPRPGARLYRTGDLARWLPDGTVEFLGRIDQQVKIRGFRIEPGEIETALGEHPGVRECVVVARTDGAGGDKRLVAYVVPSQPSSGEPAELRAFLQARLPEHMVPSAFVMLAALPLSPNGKVDRAALPAPEARREEPAAAPRTPVELVVADLWAEILGCDEVGRYDDFFAMGGHSLLATRLVSLVQQVFRVEMPLRVLFRRPTVAGIAEALLEDPAWRTQVERIADLLVQLEDEEEEPVSLMSGGDRC